MIVLDLQESIAAASVLIFYSAFACLALIRGYESDPGGRPADEDDTTAQVPRTLNKELFSPPASEPEPREWVPCESVLTPTLLFRPYGRPDAASGDTVYARHLRDQDAPLPHAS